MAHRRQQGASAQNSSPHPTYLVMINKALRALRDRKGSSPYAVLKYLRTHYNFEYDLRTIRRHMTRALRTGVRNGILKNTTGRGASGRFVLASEHGASQKKYLKHEKGQQMRKRTSLENQAEKATHKLKASQKKRTHKKNTACPQKENDSEE